VGRAELGGNVHGLLQLEVCGSGRRVRLPDLQTKKPRLSGAFFWSFFLNRYLGCLSLEKFACSLADLSLGIDSTAAAAAAAVVSSHNPDTLVICRSGQVIQK